MKYFIAVAILLCSIVSHGQNRFRSIEELTNVQDPAWPKVQQMLNAATNKVTLIAADTAQAREELTTMQVSLRSALGCVVYKTGGILIDDGWIRILGSGSTRMQRSITNWNKGKTLFTGERPGCLLIADDAIGGFFLLNEGALGKDTGRIYYLSPDNLEYEPLDLSYSDFLIFCCSGKVADFYGDYRWRTWNKDVAQLSTNSVFHFYPYLFTKEGKDINKDERTTIPIEEHYTFTMGMLKQAIEK